MRSAGFTDLFATFLLPFWLNFCIVQKGKGGLGLLDGPLDKELFMAAFGDNYAQKTVSLSGLSGRAAWDELARYADKSPGTRTVRTPARRRR